MTIPNPFTHKLVAMINKTIDTGVAMNALAHITLGLGSSLDRGLLRLDQYRDQGGKIYPNISQIPFIILRASSNEISKIIDKAKEADMAYGAFTHTMTEGTYSEQIERTHNTPTNDLIFYAGVLCGPWDEISLLTKRLSLYKSPYNP